MAILVIDVISDFAFPGGDKLFAALRKKAGAITALLERARAAALPVIYVNDNLGPWRSDFPAVKALAAKRAPEIGRLVAQLAPQASDFVILKPRHSAFYGTPLEALLEHHRISNLLLTGISAESCVWITACDAHTRGFEIVVPADTMAGASPAAVRATLTGLEKAMRARAPKRASNVRFANGRLR
jgi:nicotinamidase-related amidase